MKHGSWLAACAAAVLFCGPAPSHANGASETVLHSFPSNADPGSQLTADGQGSLYGTAPYLDGDGGVFRIKSRRGNWVYKTIFDFNGKDGSIPGPGLARDDATGIFYGVTGEGGTSNGGTVYALTPNGRGWKETVLHNFGAGEDPFGPLLRDKDTGNLYGTTYAGGGCGTAFQLVQSNGGWAFSSIYAFGGGEDGCHPSTQLRPTKNPGTLVGSTIRGGGNDDGYGTLFQLKQTAGVWSESVIYRFTGAIDGSRPFDLDAAGDGTIYGVAYGGGVYDQGTVFQLTPKHKGWEFSVIYSFGGGGDGIGPTGINFDASEGVLYGTTQDGGKWKAGTVFELTKVGGSWKENVLYSFKGGSDGAGPLARPVVNKTTGALYGTTCCGGTYNGGTVYELQP
ncbi:MAG TPA: choice-of-anchor tandem repeat GloVer-containing protein [Rhizomicrobium sp.]|nr:choice-of-anchor tandem repeat GloVer-containing protein [Rhizomicrobium sp.]